MTTSALRPRVQGGGSRAYSPADYRRLQNWMLDCADAYRAARDRRKPSQAVEQDRLARLEAGALRKAERFAVLALTREAHA